ncbi:hypothetical protein JW948_14715 [bacterium]|nr:hypothetical protein [bacterium]
MKKKRKKQAPAPVHAGRPEPVSSRKKIIFFSFMLLIPVLVFLLIETGLRLSGLFPPLPLFVSTPDPHSEYFGINTRIGERYFPGGSFTPMPRKDLFLKKKPENGFRLFVLGGSTAAGFPFGNNLTFARILNRRLSDIFPERRIEVVNTAMTAINSHTLTDFMDEILKQKPDALLIYAGHNEFYGALGAGSVESAGRYHGLIRLYLRLQRFRTFIMLRAAAGRIKPKPVRIGNDADPMETTMSRIVREKTIPKNGAVYERAVSQYRRNLHDVIRKSSRAGVPVIISELVCNLRDQAPFIASEGGSLTAAGEAFVRARKLETEQRYEEAFRTYEEARDLDQLRFRAPGDINRIIRETAGLYDVPVVPMKAVFEKASPHGLIGNSLMCDHLHPNRAGYFLMADAFYDAMRGIGLIQQDWPEHERSGEFYEKNWGFTKLDSTVAALNILHLKGGWPFQKSGPNRVFDLFSPESKEDSIALRILKSEATLETGHIELARYFMGRGQFERAFQEYRALVYTVPNLDLFYEPAVNLLVSMNQYTGALEFLLDGLHYNSSFFMQKWTGQMYLVLSRPEEGIAFLENACRLNANDETVLYNLARACYNTSQTEKGDAWFRRLKAVAPRSSLIASLKSFRQAGNGGK